MTRKFPRRRGLSPSLVRENPDGLYCGAAGYLRKNIPQDVAISEMIATLFGIDRCLRWAFQCGGKGRALVPLPGSRGCGA